MVFETTQLWERKRKEIKETTPQTRGRPILGLKAISALPGRGKSSTTIWGREFSPLQTVLWRNQIGAYYKKKHFLPKKRKIKKTEGIKRKQILSHEKGDSSVQCQGKKRARIGWEENFLTNPRGGKNCGKRKPGSYSLFLESAGNSKVQGRTRALDGEALSLSTKGEGGGKRIPSLSTQGTRHLHDKKRSRLGGK